MSASIDWAVLATTSVHLHGIAFGNVISSANVSNKHFGGGVPVFYTSPMDTSMQDIAVNNSVSLTLSEAELSGQCSPASGSNSSRPDPELPTCARLTFSGKFVRTPKDEVEAAKRQLFHVHPQMAEWPGDHDWEVCQLDIQGEADPQTADRSTDDQRPLACHGPGFPLMDPPEATLSATRVHPFLFFHIYRRDMAHRFLRRGYQHLSDPVRGICTSDKGLRRGSSRAPFLPIQSSSLVAAWVH